MVAEMTDLVQRLRGSIEDKRTYMHWQHEIMCEAADAIEKLTAERDELIEGLKKAGGELEQFKFSQTLNNVFVVHSSFVFRYEKLTAERDMLVDALKVAARIINDIPVIHPDEKVINEALAAVEKTK